MAKYINLICIALILMASLSCGGDNNDSDNQNSVVNDAEFIPVEIESADFNICDTSSFFSITAEIDDYANGDLLDNVTVSVSYTEKSTIVDDVVYDTAERQLAVVNAGDLSIGPNGLPINTFIITLQEVSSILNKESYGPEDLFKIRFEINLTDGRQFTSDTAPFVYYVALVIPFIDEPEFFSGQYHIEQLSGLDPFYATETFGDTQIVDIVADGYLRSFDFLYFPGIFDSSYNFTMTLACGEIHVLGTITAGGLGCGSNIGFSTGDPVSSYDPTYIDDDVITVNVSDFYPDGSCDTGDYPVELRFTKQ